jgi:cellobiose transport system permease protein
VLFSIINWRLIGGNDDQRITRRAARRVEQRISAQKDQKEAVDVR